MFNLYKKCSVFGHSEIEVTEELKLRVETKFENLILNGYGEFYFGGLGMFDHLCWQIITKLKEKYPHIKRIFCLTNPRFERASKRPDWQNYNNYEEIVYLPLDFDYWYTRIYYRNVEIIKRCDYIMFYVQHSHRSGAYKAMQYAIKAKKEFFNFAQM